MSNINTSEDTLILKNLAYTGLVIVVVSIGIIIAANYIAG